MQALRSWSFTRVVLTSVAWVAAWVLLGLGFAVGRLYFELRSSEGAGGMSIGVGELTIIAILAILGAPPVVLIAGWLIARWR
jgi:hypothetical protein